MPSAILEQVGFVPILFLSATFYIWFSTCQARVFVSRGISSAPSKDYWLGAG